MAAHNQKEIGEALGVSQSTVSGWLSRTLKEEKDRKQTLARSLWLSCHTQAEIADEVEATQPTILDWINSFIEISEADKSIFLADFTPPIYNIWRQQTKTNGTKHFGNSEVRWLDNLLYLYTQPFDVVIDPFAGSGSTIDICKKRSRRYFVSDRKPIVEREHEIRNHDLVGGEAIGCGEVGPLRIATEAGRDVARRAGYQVVE